jgi:pimeloyl-ACP methyl ester carboxylesterase
LEENRISFNHFSGGPSVGNAPPLVLIHGAGGSQLSWPPEIRRMEGVEVFALDLPGHGESPGEPETTVEGYARCVITWMEEQNLPKAIIAGHSMGGAITLNISLLEPDRLAGIVLVSTGGKLRVHPDILALTSDDEKFQAAAEIVTSWSFSEGSNTRIRELALERLKQGSAKVANADYNACDCFDVMDQGGDVSVPALVICGDEDRMTPAKFSRYLAENIDHAEMVLVPGAGHMVMLEKPTIVAEAIRGFIGKISSQ